MLSYFFKPTQFLSWRFSSRLKADDDVFICASEFTANLRRIATPWLLYGWWHWQCWARDPGRFQGFENAIQKRTRNRFRCLDQAVCQPWVDEQLIIMGSSLVDPVIDPSRKHCVPKQCTGSTVRVSYLSIEKISWNTQYPIKICVHQYGTKRRCRNMPSYFWFVIKVKFHIIWLSEGAPISQC